MLFPSIEVTTTIPDCLGGGTETQLYLYQWGKTAEVTELLECSFEPTNDTDDLLMLDAEIKAETISMPVNLGDKSKRGIYTLDGGIKAKVMRQFELK